MRRLLVFTILAVSINLFASDYWSPEQLKTFESTKRRAVHPAYVRPYPSSGFPQFSYPAEFYQIAEFLSLWQVSDPSSPDYGGMIEAEAGPLGDVIQTDNTQEAIVVWCKYAQISEDSLTFKPNIDAAWVYVMNYPAYNEEGSPGDDYYRNHNCAWGVWANMLYETVYGDQQYRWYADSCANYMAKHQMQVFTPNSNLNAFVMGWMAGNLYQYALYRNNAAWKDSALVIANKVLEWANTDPLTNLSDYTWAMSSGTAVWGLCRSLFQENPQLGISWIQQNSSYLPTYFDNTNGGTYIWDNAWNVALANAYAAMYQLINLPEYDEKQHWLTDYLLSLDTDDDGGIVANKWHPDTEDMSWVSAYLNMMGVANRFWTTVQQDGGIVSFLQPDSLQLLVPGDSIICQIKVANFGWEPLNTAIFLLFINDSLVLDSLVNLQQGEMLNISVRAVTPESDSLHLKAFLQSSGDQNPANDSLAFTLPLEPLYWLTGKVTDDETGNGVRAELSLVGSRGRNFSVSTDPLGNFQLRIIKDIYQMEGVCAFPFARLTRDSMNLSMPPFPNQNLHTTRSDVLLIDDDEGANYENYYLDALQEIFSQFPVLPWRGVFLWNKNELGVFPADSIIQLKYPNVIWFTGDADTTCLDTSEIELLRSLQNLQANVLLTGKNIAEFTPDSVLRELLYCSYDGDSQFLPKFIYGVNGDPVSNQLKFYTWGGNGANNQLYERDILLPTPDAVSIFHYLPQDSQVAGIRSPLSPPPGEGKTVFLAFGIEGIRNNYGNYQNRADLLKSCLIWFNDIVPIEEAGHSIPVISEFSLLPCYPNPFNSATQIELEVFHPQQIEVTVHDILGRKITTLWNSIAPAGKFKLRWTGRNQHDLPVGSGIYFINIRGERKQISQKILLIK